MFIESLRAIAAHATPILIAQLSSIGMMLVDTAVLGHVGAQDLAAVAIGGGLHVSLVFALVGILQAVTPLAARYIGAGEADEAARVLHHAVMLALILAIPGIVVLQFPGGLLSWSSMDQAIEDRVRAYLSVLSWGLPASLCYRTFYAYCNALGRPKVLMGIGFANLLLHALLAWGWGLGAWLDSPMGVTGCAISNVLVSWLALAAAMLYLAKRQQGQPSRFRRISWSVWPTWRRLLRMGLPMGLSNLVEITSFTLISLMIASLGAEVVAGHRIIATLAALCYMFPLSLGIATLSRVGRLVGGKQWHDARSTLQAGLALATLVASILAAVLWFAARPVIEVYSDVPKVIEIASGLVGFIALYQCFDAWQTILGQTLRAYHITFWPMLIQTLAFWGIGLGGGWFLCFSGPQPLGVAGFWMAAVASLIVAAVSLGILLFKVLKLPEFNA